jgi:membrane-bound metal-dependent hydrolase YbcI (DUF457 family)
MDTITHGLTGAVIGHCGFRQRGGRAALWACIAAAEFPDMDIVLALFSGETYLRWHRGPTHSLLLLPIWSWLVAILVWQLSGRKNFRPLWAASAAGMGSHLFLDLITSYGTMLLSPLSDARPALAWVFILDPYVWALLGVALWAAIRLKRHAAAPWGLAIFAAYVGMCGIAKGYAAVRSVTFTKPATSVRHYPQPLNPFRWTTVWREGDLIRWNDGTHTEEFPSYRDDDLVPKAEATSAVKAFRWFAEVPHIERKYEEGKIVLRYRDLRFRTRLPWGAVREGTFIVARVSFDTDGHLIASELKSEE